MMAAGMGPELEVPIDAEDSLSYLSQKQLFKSDVRLRPTRPNSSSKVMQDLWRRTRVVNQYEIGVSGRLRE